MSLNEQLSEIELHLKHVGKVNSEISARGVDWHLDHCLKVINSVTSFTVKSTPNDYKKSFSFPRLIVFTFKYIPRGKGKAPKVVNTINSIEIKDIESQLKTAKDSISTLSTLSKNHHFKHPVFGVLNLNQILTFLNIHTKHHLKIIKDIIM